MKVWKINNGQGERILESLSLMAVMKCEVVLFWLSMQCQDAMPTYSQTSETFIYLSTGFITNQ